MNKPIFKVPFFVVESHTYYTDSTKTKQLLSPSNLLAPFYYEKYRGCNNMYADNGTNGHKILENFMNDIKESTSIMSDYKLSILKAMKQLLAIKAQAEWFVTEQKVMGEQLAGTIDLIYEKNNVINIIDYKFSKDYNIDEFNPPNNKRAYHNFHAVQIYAYYQILLQAFPKKQFKGYIWYVNKEELKRIEIDLTYFDHMFTVNVLIQFHEATKHLSKSMHRKWYLKDK